MRSPRILICGTQIPFARGGAEALVQSLQEQLQQRGFDVERVVLPFAWAPRVQIFRSAMAWRLLDLTAAGEVPVDLVICTRFPSYAVRHPNKVVWLIHQFRQVYELLDTEFSDFKETSEDQAAIEMVHRLDRSALSEARRLFTISGNTASRLKRYLDLDAQPLYPPSPLREALTPGESGEYILSVGRLDPMKRTDLLIAGLARARGPLRAMVVGEGPELESLRELSGRLGVDDRVEFVGRVDDEKLATLYSGALGVFYAPFDEDYGYVTVEAFHSGKPVITSADSGGVLEFVEHDVTGLVAKRPTAEAMAALLDRLWNEREEAAAMGERGLASVADMDWDHVVASLTATL